MSMQEKRKWTTYLVLHTRRYTTVQTFVVSKIFLNKLNFYLAKMHQIIQKWQ